VGQAARSLRTNMTEAEQVLWAALRYRKARGLRFRRQHPVGRFVLDFFCPSAKLAVEVDGEVHDQQTERDEERTRVLGAQGIRVLRFRNDDVLSDLPSVVRRITAAARETL
jgi:very-short-patch-repair endonuclease